MGQTKERINEIRAFLTKVNLKKLYIKQNLSVGDIAKIISVNPETVRNYLKKFNITKSQAAILQTIGNKKRVDLDYDKLYHLYISKNRTKREVAKKLKTTIAIVINNIKRYGIKKDPNAIQKTARRKVKEKYGVKTIFLTEEHKKKCNTPETIAKSKKTWDKKRKRKLKPFLKEVTKKKKKVLLRYKLGFTSRLIAKSLNLNYYAINDFLTQQGKKKHLSRERTILPKQYLKNNSIFDIGKKLNIGKDVIIDSLLHHNIYDVEKQRSEGEKRLSEFVSHYVEVDNNNRNTITKELDILIPNKNMAIEYNGVYWHSELFKDKKYHVDKYQQCLDKGIKLIQVYDIEYIERQRAVHSRIRALLGVNSHRIGARKTKVKKFDKSDKNVKKFLDKYHVQGATNFKFGFKLIYEKKIVAVMTFNRHHRHTSKELVLNRYCVREDYSISGGASKLLNCAMKEIQEPIISYSDNRWSDGNLYKKLGFSLVKEIKHDYFYFKNSKIFSKQSLRKTEKEKKSNMTEKELRFNQGYLRVYDAGKIKWKLEQRRYD